LGVGCAGRARCAEVEFEQITLSVVAHSYIFLHSNRSPFFALISLA
jgi:hypothetical protein